MARSPFVITTASDTAHIDRNGHGEVVITVTNTVGSALRGRARCVPQGSAQIGWIKVREAERDFTVSATQQFTVSIDLSKDCKPGKYSFRFDVVSVALPDEDYTQGPTITFSAALATPPPPKVPIWVILVVAVLVIGGGAVGIWLAVRPSPSPTPPEATSTPVSQASATPGEPMVPGFDLPGSDYVNFSAGSASVCRDSCGGEPRCQAWSWVKPGIQGPTGVCWLKDTLPALVRNDCCTSGSREYISKRDLGAEDRTDRPGSDYRNFDADSWDTCEAACETDQTCAAWTYALPGLQGPRGRCWLKVSVPRPVDSQRTVSGVKFRPSS